MRKITVLSVSLIVTFTLAAVSAGGASAKSALVLKENGKAVKPGAMEVLVAGYSPECFFEENEGTLSVNDAKTDKIKYPSVWDVGDVFGCEGGKQELEMTSAGTATLKGKMRIGVAGPCMYEYKKISGKFNTTSKDSGDEPQILGAAVGKLSKSGSSHTCSKTTMTSFELFLIGNEGTIETELVE